MFRPHLRLAWIGIVFFSGMFLLGQQSWSPCLDLDRDGYGDPASDACAFPDPDCDDSNPDINPGAPEDCADMGPDNDCDGLADQEDPDCEDCGDGFEPNETCDAYSSLGTVFEDDGEQSWSGRIYPSGDEDFFRFFAETNPYHLCDFGRDQYLSIRVRMVPSGGTPCRDYDLSLYDDDCSLLGTSTLRGCQEERITFTWDLLCLPEDSRYFRVKVSGYEGSYDCSDYELYLDLWRDY